MPHRLRLSRGHFGAHPLSPPTGVRRTGRDPWPVPGKGERKGQSREKVLLHRDHMQPIRRPVIVTATLVLIDLDRRPGHRLISHP